MPTHRQLLQLADSLAPAIRKAFLDAVRDIRDGARINAIADAIANGRIEEVADLLGIRASAFVGITEAVRAAFAAGGAAAVAEIPALRMRSTQSTRAPTLRVRFDLRNPRAEQWLANESSRLVTEIVESQRALIRAAATDGLARGINPRTTALQIVGRIGANGRRSGGIVGLTTQQASYVANAREELSSLNPISLSRYLSRERRDRRFDATIRRAMDEGRQLDDATIDRIVGRYADSLLQLRGETIARTESLAALNSARESAFQQAIDEGLLRAGDLVKRWSATLDPRTRDAHAMMNGTAKALDEPFVSLETGSRMMYPGDVSMGAGGVDTINCRCILRYDVDMVSATLEDR